MSLVLAVLGELGVWVALISAVILWHWWPLAVLGVFYIGVWTVPSILPLEGISEDSVRAARRNVVIGTAAVVAVALLLLAVKNNAL